jgi:Rieske Fe-S protein
MATDRRPKATVTRRSFCNTALLVSAGLALAPGDASSQKPKDEQALLAYPPMKIDGAERVLPGSFLYFNYPKQSDPAVLLRTTDGLYLAYSRKCAHLGCSVDFDKGRRCLTCPCHRGVYDSRTGYVIFGPPPRPLDQIILQVRGGGEIWAVGKALGGDHNASAKEVRTDSGGTN